MLEGEGRNVAAHFCRTDTLCRMTVIGGLPAHCVVKATTAAHFVAHGMAFKVNNDEYVRIYRSACRKVRKGVLRHTLSHRHTLSQFRKFATKCIAMVGPLCRKLHCNKVCLNRRFPLCTLCRNAWLQRDKKKK
jgi:hypothetical protein